MLPRPFSRFAMILNLLVLMPDRAGPTGRDDSRGKEDARAGMYQSPSWGWLLRFDPAKWRKDEDSSKARVDRLVLVSRLPGSRSTRVMFRTEPQERPALHAELVKAAKHLASRYPGAMLEIAHDIQGDPILKETGDGHWIGSYILSSAQGDDKIVELDAIAIRDTKAIVIVQAVTLPADYDDEFQPIERLRSGMAFGSVSLFDLGAEESGASRPRVQY
jgi:hypothetical protein